MEKTSTPRSRKPASRSRLTRSRKGTGQDNNVVVNTAEARREIVNALHLHRSSSTPPQQPQGPQQPPSCFGSKWAFQLGGASASTGTTYDHQQQGCSLYTLPLPQPTWSTTSPSIFPTSSITSSSSSSTSGIVVPSMEMMMMNEFEWADELASSYTWWLGFLKTLDGKEITRQQQKEKNHDQPQQQTDQYSCPAAGNINALNDSRKLGDEICFSASAEDEECEWLIMSDHDQLEDI